MLDVYNDYIDPNGIEEDHEYLRYLMVEEMIRFSKMDQSYSVR